MEIKSEKYLLSQDASPVYPEHPGGILGEELKARGISQKKFAEAVGLQATHLSALIHGTRTITPAVAEKIASGLKGIAPEFWIKLQERYKIDIQRKRINPSRLVSGYNHSVSTLQPAFLAQPETGYGRKIKVQLTIPESDKDLLYSLASRLGWE